MLAPARAYFRRRLHRSTTRCASLRGTCRPRIALDVLDLNTGYVAGFNAAKSMPAASTIKVPVMVAKSFAQLAGRPVSI